MLNRRNFICNLSKGLGATPFVPFFSSEQGTHFLHACQEISNSNLDQSITDETFWYQVQQAYTVSPNIINLNNGGVSPQPKVVQEAVERYNQLSNEAPSYYMWRVLDQGREPVRAKLADLAGCSPEEIAINRNASEALETIIFGLPLQRGDEVVLTKQDYPNMINAWKQRALRDGIVLRWLSFDFPIENAEPIVEQFADAFNERTKVVHITHMINWNGQVLPVKQIAKIAHEKSIEVLVDGAHTFAQLDFSIPDLDCDYFGTSLHKWLCAPFGSGMMYVKKDKIKKVFPLFAANDPQSEDIRKFENLGTRSFAIEQGIGQAVNFHHMIGSERKAKRLFYLKNYWDERVSQFPGVSVATPKSSTFSGAIGSLVIEGKTPNEVANQLFKEFKIHSVAINWENIHGVRLTPNVYTTIRDLDKLIQAVKVIAKA